MRTWLIYWWDTFRSSFWFLPSLLILLSVVLAMLMPELDSQLGAKIEDNLGVIISTAPAARLSLSSIAGALITITGVVFSLTLVALTTTASQFGSRLIRKMMDDRMTQLALGALMSTSLYCLLVVRVILDSETVSFVPHLSVALGFLLTIISVGLFIGFIHHVATQLQAPNLIHSVAMELRMAIERLYPESIGVKASEPPINLQERLDALGDNFAEVTATICGYLQGVDGEGLIEAASGGDLILHVPCRPGDFIIDGGALARVWPKERVNDGRIHDIRSCFVIGRSRTPRQDVEYAINELVEIAVRALSPGINDPFTAMTCLDYLGSALARFATRKLPSPVREDKGGNMRVLTSPVTFRSILDCAFSMILHYGRTSPAVLMRLLQIIEAFGDRAQTPDRHKDVVEMLERIQMSCEAEFADGYDRRRLLDECERLRESLKWNSTAREKDAASDTPEVSKTSEASEAT